MKPRLIIAILALLLIAPVIANPNGPPWQNGSDLVIDTGCTCHGDGAPSTEVVVSISGVPRSYSIGESYEFTISLQHASNEEGGFLLWDYNSGTLQPGEGSQTVPEEAGALSQSEPGNNWVVTWIAPESNIGSVSFQLVGNAVNGNGQFDGGDLWNILSFSISSPDSTYTDDSENLQLRTISVGDYDSLFVAEEDPAAIEAARQEEIADDFFTNGNLFYWTTLSIIIIGAVVQGEFYERRFGGGPPHLDMSLAVPQGVRRGILSIITILMFAWSIDSSQAWGIILLTAMLMLWAIFSVYRTVVQARAPKQYTDLV
ncbi:MAG: choice-of-anchor V domain-containing protein [Candidatus Thermoplasmatota archaeon]|nr:choice-of-anchor V domain-containing protein [Candidatus Thermoplasmatota archaeon]